MSCIFLKFQNLSESMLSRQTFPSICGLQPGKVAMIINNHLHLYLTDNLASAINLPCMCFESGREEEDPKGTHAEHT